MQAFDRNDKQERDYIRQHSLASESGEQGNSSILHCMGGGGGMGACAQNSFMESHLEVVDTCQWFDCQKKSSAHLLTPVNSFLYEHPEAENSPDTPYMLSAICLRDLYGVTQDYKITYLK